MKEIKNVVNFEGVKLSAVDCGDCSTVHSLLCYALGENRVMTAIVIYQPEDMLKLAATIRECIDLEEPACRHCGEKHYKLLLGGHGDGSCVTEIFIESSEMARMLEDGFEQIAVMKLK